MAQQGDSARHSSSQADAHRGDIPAAQQVHPYSRILQWIAARAESAAELGCCRAKELLDQGLSFLHGSIPMPRMEVRRRSALRVRLRWHGFSHPAGRLQPNQTCELYL